MDKTGAILLSRPAICRMLGELAGERFTYGVKMGTERNSVPDPVDVLGTGRGVMYRYQDVMQFFDRIGLTSAKDNT